MESQLAEIIVGIDIAKALGSVLNQLGHNMPDASSSE